MHYFLQVRSFWDHRFPDVGVRHLIRPHLSRAACWQPFCQIQHGRTTPPFLDRNDLFLSVAVRCCPGPPCRRICPSPWPCLRAVSALPRSLFLPYLPFLWLLLIPFLFFPFQFSSFPRVQSASSRSHSAFSQRLHACHCCLPLRRGGSHDALGHQYHHLELHCTACSRPAPSFHPVRSRFSTI